MPAAVESRLQATRLSPSLTVDDLGKSMAFFEALGFGIEEKWEENGVLMGAMMRAGDISLGLSQDDWKKGRDRQKGIGMRLYIGTSQNLDELAAEAKKAGLTLDTEPYDTPWGSRAFDLTEPTGFKVTVGNEV